MNLGRARVNRDLVGVLSGTISHYVSFISKSNNIGGYYKSTRGTNHYGFIPSSPTSIGETLLRLRHHVDGGWGRHKFLDIGCGIGNIVLLANILGFDAYGLEYKKEIYDIAKSLAGKNNIFKGNMATFEKYSEYDVLYYYEPMCDGRAMEKFAIKLAKAMKVGAYVIPNGHARTFSGSKEFKLIKLMTQNDGRFCHPVYRKISKKEI